MNVVKVFLAVLNCGTKPLEAITVHVIYSYWIPT